MKKFITLGMTLLLTVSAGAQDAEVRKIWDFRQGFSQETLDNLSADTKESNGYWTDMSASSFYESKKRSSTGELKCKIGGEDWVIPETKGIVFSGTSAKHICLQYESAKFGSHVWLNGGKAEDAITIPSVPAGDSVTVIFSSHKDTENRGFTIKTSGFTGKDGSTTTWKTTAMDTAVIINNNDVASDLKLQATSGMHYHFICVGKVPSEDADTRTKIAYLYDSGYENYDPESDLDDILNVIMTEKLSDVKYTRIDVAGDVSAVTADSLETFDAVIVSSAINATNPYASTIKEAIAFVPMLNLSTNLYEAWGYGKATTTQTNEILVGEAARKSSLFSPSDSEAEPYISEDGKLQLLAEGGAITGYTAEEGTYFANDSVYATADGINAIHIHNDKHNAYLMIPYSYDQAPDESAIDILYNAVSLLTNTKAAITNTGKPSISESYSHLATVVSIKSATKNAKVYYTIDGSTPTTASTAYTEPFVVNDENVTVKAIALADGYLLSDIAEKTISIHELAKAPSFSLDEADGQTTVTIVPATEGDSIFFNYTGSDAIAQSELYTAPITLTKHATITAFAAAKDKYLQSVAVSEAVEVKNEKVRLDILSQFDANKEDWQPTAGTYYIGKSGYNFYTDEVIGTYEDSLGIHNKYAEADSLFTHNPGKGWELKTYGQVVAWEANSLGHAVGNVDAYNPATAYDNSETNASNYHITFAGVGSNGDGEKDPTSAALQTTEALQAPFDIVAILGGKGAIKMEVFVSTDTTDVANWQSIGFVYSPDVEADTKGRLYQKNLLSYEGTDKVFVKLAAKNTSGRLFNVIVYNAGEKSEQYTGIVNVNKADEAAGEVVRTIVYSMNGTQLNKAAKGVNIVKTIYANGSVKTQKVIVK